MAKNKSRLSVVVSKIRKPSCFDKHVPKTHTHTHTHTHEKPDLGIVER